MGGRDGSWASRDNAGKIPFARDIGANYVNLATIFFADRATGHLFIEPDLNDFAGMPEALHQGRAAGLHSAVYVFLLDHDARNTLNQPWDPPDPDQFFADYKQLVLAQRV